MKVLLEYLEYSSTISNTPVVMCGFAKNQEEFDKDQVKNLTELSDNFNVTFLQLHGKNTGLLWKTLLKPLTRIAREVKETINEPLVVKKGKKKKKCAIQ
jgi:hypothetical protein